MRNEKFGDDPRPETRDPKRLAPVSKLYALRLNITI